MMQAAQARGEKEGVGLGVLRMIKPWTEWMLMWGYEVAAGPPEITDEFARELAVKLVGTDDFEMRVTSGCRGWAELREISDGGVLLVRPICTSRPGTPARPTRRSQPATGSGRPSPRCSARPDEDQAGGWRCSSAASRSSSWSIRCRRISSSACSASRRSAVRRSRGEASARSATIASGTSRCGPCGPSTSRDGICPERYQVRSAARDAPVSAAARSSVTQSEPSSWADSSSSSSQSSSRSSQSEHILLGLVREGEGVAAQILTEHAGDLEAVRQAVLDLLPAAEALQGRRWLRRRNAPLPGEPGEAGEPGESGDAAGMPTTPAADAGLAEAARLAGGEPVGSHHLLLAALADPDSAAARTLTALGVNLDEARAALRDADVTGTSDEPPEQRGRRHMTLRVTGESLTLQATDPALLALARAAVEAVGDQAAGPGTISGDLPVSGSLAQVWLALRDSLEDIREHAAGGSQGPVQQEGGPGKDQEGGPGKGRPAA